VTGIPFAPRALAELVRRHGGELLRGAKGTARRVLPTDQAAAGDLTVVLHARYLADAVGASDRGAILLVDASLAGRSELSTRAVWRHPFAAWALAEILDTADSPADEPIIGADCFIGQGVILAPRVRIGSRVTIGPGAVIGAAGFGFATGPDGVTRDVPQLGGVVIEDGVHIGALSTIAAGTIAPTLLRRGAKLDAQVHVGHNCDIGENTIIAAQTGIAGSVTVGRGVLMGGQVGIADHLTIGDGARIAAKSGVIGDVAAGATVAGYPAVERQRWLRGLAELYRLASGGSSPPARQRTPTPPGAQRNVPDPARAETMPAPSGLDIPDVPASVRQVAPIPRTDPET
jgi:UDP-3-O-[3-hydroxymyristoyl] glucosamine N-acyltransferase